MPGIVLSQNSLLKHSNFLKLWSPQSVSVLGSQVSGLALPTVAVLMLGATAQQMALISIMIAMDFGRTFEHRPVVPRENIARCISRRSQSASSWCITSRKSAIVSK